MKRIFRILIVDDEPDVTDLLGYQLERAGYSVEILNDPLTLIGTTLRFAPDLIVLDVMMPKIDGLQACRMLRADVQCQKIPIMFLTAKGEAEDRIKGLESGADDYLCKPFDNRELLLRIKVLLKRSETQSMPQSTNVIRIGEIELDPESHEVTVAGENVVLTVTEFKLLNLLMMRKGRVQSRDNLLINVWNYDNDIETRTVDTHIRRIREKLGAAAKMIKTVRGVGYRIIEE